MLRVILIATLSLLFRTIVLCQSDTIIYFPNGQIKQQGAIFNGLKMGVWNEFWNEDTSKGKIREVVDYGRGKTFHKKVYNFFDENFIGQECTGYIDENGKEVLDGEYIYNYYDGTRKILHYKDGIKVGESNTYYEGGQIKRIEKFLDNELNGGWIEFYSNGNIKEKGSYMQNERIGKWQKFHENGNLKSQGVYLPNHIVVESSENAFDTLITSERYEDYKDKDGGFSFPLTIFLKKDTWKYYSEQGKLIKEEIYDKGKLIETKEYDD